VNVSAGQDPHNTCNANLANCVSASCDGNGGCSDPNGTVCVAQACSSGQQTVSTCQGGACTASSPVICSPYICSGNACLTSCGGNDNNCIPGYFCNGMNCQSKRGLGSGCSSGNQCSSGFCVDGVCCNQSSCPTCMDCGASGGMCNVTVTNTIDPDSCTGNNICDASGNCKLKDGQGCGGGGACASGNCVNGVCCNSSCNGGAPSCSGNTVLPNTCSTGSCNTTPVACSTGYTCDPNPPASCATTCTCATSPCLDATHCASGYYCSGTACTKQGAGGDPCVPANNGVDCASGTCKNNNTCM
jgi:hypothetical protein